MTSKLIFCNYEFQEELPDVVEVKQLGQVAVDLVVNVLEVAQGDGPAHEVLVERLDQMHWGDLSVHQRLTKNTPYKMSFIGK